MNYLAEIKDALQRSGCDFSENEPLGKYTSFKIGGPAPLVLRPHTTEQLLSALSTLKQYEMPHYLLGNGSNVLIADEGVTRPVILLSQGEFCEIAVCGERITAGAGALLIAVCRRALQEALAGLAFAYGIPGSVGGAVFMNAGAYGGELSQILESVRFVDEAGQIRTELAEQLHLSYRHSIFTENPNAIILSAVFRLEKGDKDAIRAQMEELMARRKEKPPLEYPSAGSTFKRPQGHFAGALIEQAGLKGCTVGGAAVSEKHAGFVINRGGATAKDVRTLIAHIQKTVWEKSGVQLEPEIRFFD